MQVQRTVSRLLKSPFYTFNYNENACTLFVINCKWHRVAYVTTRRYGEPSHCQICITITSKKWCQPLSRLQYRTASSERHWKLTQTALVLFMRLQNIWAMNISFQCFARVTLFWFVTSCSLRSDTDVSEENTAFIFGLENGSMCLLRNLFCVTTHTTTTLR